MSLLKELDTENAFNGRQIGRYRLGRELGHGAFGRVYFATDTDLDREVALKFLRPVDGKYSDNLKARFEREAKLVSKLQGQHTITLFEYGELEELVFLAFEYIDGQTLQDMLEDATHAIHSLRVAKILEQSLEGLKEAHHYGIMHRDIKPANIMIYEHIGVPDRIKVMDFGIGKNLYKDEGLSTLTNDNAMLGTPLYMSPEHMKSDLELSPQSDIYSLGMVAYEMLTGSSPYQGMSPFNIFTEIAMGPDIQLAPTERIPGGLSRVINKMLKKDTSERYTTTQEALDDLLHLKPQPLPDDPPNTLYDSEVSGPLVVPGAALEATPPTAEIGSPVAREDTLSMSASSGEFAARDTRTKLTIAALVATCVGSIALIGVLLASSGDPVEPEASAEANPAVPAQDAPVETASAEDPPAKEREAEPEPEPVVPTPAAEVDAGSPEPDTGAEVAEVAEPQPEVEPAAETGAKRARSGSSKRKTSTARAKPKEQAKPKPVEATPDEPKKKAEPKPKEPVVTKKAPEPEPKEKPKPKTDPKPKKVDASAFIPDD